MKHNMEPSRYSSLAGLLIIADGRLSTASKSEKSAVEPGLITPSVDAAPSTHDSKSLPASWRPTGKQTRDRVSRGSQDLSIQKLSLEQDSISPSIESLDRSSSTNTDHLAPGADPSPEERQYTRLIRMIDQNWVEPLSTDLVQFSDTIYKQELWVRAFRLACSQGHGEVLQCLLQFFFKPVKDSHGRKPTFRGLGKKMNMLHTLAQGGLLCNLTITPEIHGILASSFSKTELLAELDGWDKIPLQWALVAGDSTMCRMLLDLTPEPTVSRVIVDADSHGWTPLHYACKHNLFELAARLFNRHKRGIHARTKDHELPLHIACRNDHRENIDLVTLLLHSATRTACAPRWDGQTPLHLAASEGRLATVQYMLQAMKDRHSMHVQDNSGKTPLMLVREREMMEEFAPWHVNTCATVPTICEKYKAFVCKWRYDSGAADEAWSDPMQIPLYRLLYEQDEGIMFTPDLQSEHLTWIHVPANNREWCDHLLIKWYLENDEHEHPDVGGLIAAHRAFSQQHIGPQKQDRFLRPGIQYAHPPGVSAGKRSTISANMRGVFDTPKGRVLFIAAPFVNFDTESNLKRMQKILKSSRRDVAAKRQDKSLDERLYSAYLDDPGFHPRRTLDQYIYHNMDTADRDSDQVIQRFQRVHMRGVPGVDVPGYAFRERIPHEAISSTATLSPSRSMWFPDSQPESDPTTLMVDQLWIWILGERLVITCAPRRWSKPEDDPYDAFDRLKASILPSAFEPPKSAGELVMNAMMECFGTFDRHARSSPRLQVMNMFEQSIGIIAAEESSLLKRFSEAYKTLNRETDLARPDKDRVAEDQELGKFVHTLNNLTTETDLLTELKDIRDELHIMSTVLEDQQTISHKLFRLEEMLARNKLTKLFGPTKATSGASERQEDLFEPLNAMLNQGLQDIERLDAQAVRLSESLSELLQLKQAHSNAFELEFSRTLSLETTKLSRDAAKQGQAVLVFTIVTIVFSPLSFIAAFFTMQLTNLPGAMSLSYVSKYIFGFGFAVAIPCIILAFSVSSWWPRAWRSTRQQWGHSSGDREKPGPEAITRKRSFISNFPRLQKYLRLWNHIRNPPPTPSPTFTDETWGTRSELEETRARLNRRHFRTASAESGRDSGEETNASAEHSPVSRHQEPSSTGNWKVKDTESRRRRQERRHTQHKAISYLPR